MQTCVHACALACGRLWSPRDRPVSKRLKHMTTIIPRVKTQNCVNSWNNVSSSPKRKVGHLGETGLVVGRPLRRTTYPTYSRASSFPLQNFPGYASPPKCAMIIVSTYGVDRLYHHSMLINSPKWYVAQHAYHNMLINTCILSVDHHI